MERDNPDPELLVPVVEVGIHALKRRFENQNVESKTLHTYANDMDDAMNAIESAIAKSSIRLRDLKTKQAALYNRLLAILSKIEVLRCRNVPLNEDEIK